MALPAGVTTAEVTFGPALNHAGTGGVIEGQVKADRKLVWTATGETLYAVPQKLGPTAAGAALTFTVPHVDQDGFTDASGAAITGWAYTFEGLVTFGSTRVRVVKTFQVFADQTTVDLDTVPDGPATAAVVGPSSADRALAAATEAESSATAAASSASAAASSATAAESAAATAASDAVADASAAIATDVAAASSSADAAAGSATAADTAATAAATAQTGAETARTGAETARDAAAASATAADTSADQAAASATAAATSATNADTAAADAITTHEAATNPHPGYAQRAASMPPRLIIPPPRTASVITQFQTGHGWTVSGAATNNANDTTTYAKGTQSVLQVTNTTAGLTTLSKSALTLNFTDLSPRVTFRIDNPQDMVELYLYLGDGTNYFIWNLDFDSETNRRFTAGEWVTITESFASYNAVIGTPNRANITIANIRFRGRSGAAVTGHFQAVETAPGQSTYPNGVISVTFDDGYDTNYTLGRPRLDQYGFGATNFLIADRVGQAGFLTLAQAKQLEAVNGWENAAHAYTLASHDARLTSLTGQALDDELYQLKKFMVDNDFRGRDLLAYPGARWNPEVRAVAGRYFAYGRHLAARNSVKAETLPPSDRLVAQAVSDISSHASGLSIANTQAFIDKVKAQKGWGVLTFHRIVAGTPASAVEISQTDYNTIIDYLNTTGVAVRTVSDALAGR